MRGECHSASILGEFSYRGEGEYLEPSAVCENRPVPRNESVQTSDISECVESGAKIQMVCVAEDYLGPYVFFQIPVVYALDRPDSPDGHEYGGMYVAVVSRDYSASRIRLSVGRCLYKLHLYGSMAAVQPATVNSNFKDNKIILIKPGQLLKFLLYLLCARFPGGTVGRYEADRST